MESGIVSVSAELQELFKTVNNTSKIKKGTYLFQEGQVANELFLILSGKVQISKVTVDGRELTLRICSEGDLVGELILFSAGIKYMVHAKVIEDGEVAVINKATLEDELSKNSTLALEFIKWMSDHFRRTQTRFRDLVLHGKKGALYSTLIRMTNSYGVMKEDGILIKLQLTNQDLANFCGTSREVINRMLSELKKNEIITMENGFIKIKNIYFLKAEVECEDCPIELCNIE